MSTHQVIGYTPEIGKALKRIMAETPQTDTGKLAYPNGKKQSTINTKAKASSVSNVYNGFFKIIDVSERDENGSIVKPIVKVVDGKSYSPETGESESMLVSVNGRNYNVQSAKVELQKKESTIGLMVHLHGSSSATVEQYINRPPDQTLYDFYKSFGRVQVTRVTENDTKKWVINIFQDHDSGILEGTWYNICGDLIDE